MQRGINYLISELLDYATKKGLISKLDTAYCVCGVLDVLSLTDFSFESVSECRPVCEILSDIADYAVSEGKCADTAASRDLFDTKIMGKVTKMPSSVIAEFNTLYKRCPKDATDYFYNLCIDSNYIRADRISRDVKWTSKTEYGEIDITINLSKPEKDPKDIAAAKLLPQSGFPKCALCHENEGFAGTLTKPARQTLRQIPINMAGEEWYLQYSPYVYYNEHCIALSARHTPMAINGKTFEKLLSFVEIFPHYFIGSNADLPIVGGSILSHDHMQGGRYEFAMERAKIDTPLTFEGFPEVTGGIVRWPMSVIRLVSEHKDSLVRLASKILAAWRGYTDESAFIYAETNGVPHNTITPIARTRANKFELDLVLRNNITTEEHPLGVYHPHAEHHNIKKENIGLIEVMGLAVLPSRLKSELAILKEEILAGCPCTSDSTAKHLSWYNAFKGNYTFTKENTEDILKDEVGKTFLGVLTDAGVYKDTNDGKSAFMRFVNSVGGRI